MKLHWHCRVIVCIHSQPLSVLCGGSCAACDMGVRLWVVERGGRLVMGLGRGKLVLVLVVKYECAAWAH